MAINVTNLPELDVTREVAEAREPLVARAREPKIEGNKFTVDDASKVPRRFQNIFLLHEDMLWAILKAFNKKNGVRLKGSFDQTIRSKAGPLCVPIALRHYCRAKINEDYHHEGFMRLMDMDKLSRHGVPINWENIRESADVLGESTAMAGFAVLSALFRRRQFDLAYFEEATPTTPSHGVLSEENLVRLIQSNGPTIVRYVKHWIVIERIYSTKPVLFLVREPTRYTELKVQTFRDVKAGRRLDFIKERAKTQTEIEAMGVILYHKLNTQNLLLEAFPDIGIDQDFYPAEDSKNFDPLR